MKLGLILSLFLVSLALADSYTYSDLSEAKMYLSAAGGGGKILFGYGDNSGGYTNKIDIYDVATRTWSQVNQGTSRHQLTAAYADGQILFGGGYNGTRLNNVDIYNVSSGSFSSASLSEGRIALAAAGTGQRILFGGGSTGTGYSNVVDIYFTNNNTWADTTFSSTVERSYHAATAAGGKILFAGGQNAGGVRSEVDIYNTETDEWEAVEYLSEARNSLAGAGAGDLAIFAGGYSSSYYTDVVDIFNVTAGTQSASALSEPRSYPAGAAVDLGKGIFFFGGGFLGATESDHLDIYDAELDAWHFAKLEIERYHFAAASSGNTTIFGGGYSGSYESEAEIFEISGDCRPRSAAAATAGDSVYFLSGEGGGPNGTISYSRADVYDSNLEEWSTFGLSRPRRGAAAGSAGGYLFLGGGLNPLNGTETDYVELIKLSDGSHSNMTLNSARSHLAATGLGGWMFFAGGYPLSAEVDIILKASEFHLVASLSAARYRLAAASTVRYAVFAGGMNGTHALDEVDIYDTYLVSWYTATIAEPRYNLAGAGVGDYVFFAGGENGTYFFGVVDMFDLDSSTQTTMNLATARSQLAAVATEDGEYVAFGGGIGDTGPLDTIEIYNVTNGVWAMEYLSVASYELSGGAVGTTVVFMAGKIGEHEWSCAVDEIVVDIQPPAVSSSSFSSSEVSSVSSASSASPSASSSTSMSSASSTTSGASIASPLGVLFSLLMLSLMMEL